MASPRRKLAEVSDRLREAADEQPRDDHHPIDQFTAVQHGAFIQLPVGEITPNPDQPRKHFDPQALDELTASVREKGVLQPVIAMKNPNGAGFVLIAGERRWRAAQAVGLSKIPAVIRERPDSMEVALIENVQRQNLNPIEEAQAYERLKRERGYTDELLAKVVGKSRTTVTETLALNQLSSELKEQLSVTDNVPKTLILQAFRAGGEGKVREVLAGETRVTTLELRKKKTGRPKHHQETHHTQDGVFRVTITATKAKADPMEVKAALLEIANEIA